MNHMSYFIKEFIILNFRISLIDLGNSLISNNSIYIFYFCLNIFIQFLRGLMFLILNSNKNNIKNIFEL